jgi:hypothetical protein
MDNKVIITENPSFIPKIECLLTLNIERSTHTTTLRFGLNKFADFLKKIDDKDWKPMKVSHQGKMKDNPAVRSSKINSNIRAVFDYYYERKVFYINNESCLLIDNDLIKFDTTSLVNGISHFKIIRYDEGEHFDEFHYDTKNADYSAKTIGTALLFPPADISPFTGGDLVFKIEEGDQVSLQTIHPSKFTEWTLITFGHLLHKCTPVLSGTRYVFKAEIWSMYPDIKKPIELSLESISSVIREQQSRKQELLSNARQQIANLYSKYLDDIQIKIEDRKRDILEHSGDKTLVLSNDTTSDIHYKDHNILVHIDKDVDDDEAIKYQYQCKEASRLYYYKNTMYVNLDILKINYNNLVIFLDDDNDVYLDVEQILSTRDFSTQLLSLKHNGKKDYHHNDENGIEFDEKLKTILVLSSLYEEPYDFNIFNIKHLKLLRQIIHSGYKFTLLNKRYEMYVSVMNYWENSNNPEIKIERELFNWIFECPKYPGVMQNKDSEYNDEGGCNDTLTYESTCILLWRDM